MTPRPPADGPPSFGAAFRVWLRIGLLSFGGPAGQIALMHRILVEERRWIDERRFLHALNYCMLLPGPEAQQLATYVGWLLHRTAGGLVAGTLFVLPGAAVILTLSILYAGFGQFSIVAALFFGIKAAVLAVVIEAVVRIGRRAIRSGFALAVACLAFVGIFFLALPFPMIVIGAAVAGYLAATFRPGYFDAADGGTAADAAADEAAAPPHTRPNLRRAILVTLVFGLLWLAPVALLAGTLGPSNVFAQEGFFFAKMAVVTFGGAYAVLAYVAQQAVEIHGWLMPGEMLDGLGLAETTPGPLILVTQFVGFMGAYRTPGALDPFVAGTLGALLTSWVTFMPCFLWIFLGAPYIERLGRNRRLAAALSTLTAAVVGVILNLAAWFALHVVFAEVSEIRLAGIRLFLPVWETVEPGALVLAIGALVAMLRFKAGMLPTLAVSALLGAAYFYIVR